MMRNSERASMTTALGAWIVCTMASPRGAVRRFTKFRGQRKVMKASRVWCQPFPAVRQIIIYNLECLKARV